jgi:hypothetical protein
MASSVSLSLALTVQLEALQVAVGDAIGALNARGDTLEDHLQDASVRVREVALHGIHSGAWLPRGGEPQRLLGPGG